VDKIKQALKWSNKNRFWLGSAALALAMLICWILVSNSIDANTSKYTSDVQSNISKANAIMNVSAEDGDVKVHPNTTTENGMRELLNQSADELVKAWKLRYNAQAKILQWPKEILADQKFCDYFNVHNPPETYPLESERGIEAFSTLYLNQIPRQMERICRDTLRTKWNYDPAYSKADYKFTPDEELSRFAVAWDEMNQDLWHKKLTSFRGFDDHGNTIEGPTGLQIYMLQQDLWLLEAMFEVIRQINGDVSANDQAKIKKIDHVAFGREARTQLGKLSPLEVGAAGAASSLDAAPPADPSTTEAPATTFDPFASKKPFHGRYVNAAFQPISADEVLTVLQAVKKGDPLPATGLELIVAKRVPVRIALRMDEREIPNFMTACANSPFAFEIRQVRKNRHVPGQGIALNGGDGSGGGSMGNNPMGESRGGGRGMPGGGDRTDPDVSSAMGGSASLGGAPRGGAPGGGSSDQPESKKAETRTNYDIDVEFYGIVKIYNPVSEDYFKKVIGATAGASASLHKTSQFEVALADR
jgi:hypothetical protein